MARRRGQPIPQGWGIDNQGRGTTNHDDIVAGGALLLLGSDRERGGHKGYVLAIMVDVLCGALGGANWGPLRRPLRCARKFRRAVWGRESDTFSARCASMVSSRPM